MNSPTTCSPAEAAQLATTLLGRTIARASPVGGGGNNRLFRVEEADGTCAALKFYPPQTEDPRDRLGQEFAFLQFLNRQGVAGVPTALVRDRERHVALYSWVDGQVIHDADAAAVDAMLGFLEQLHLWRHAPGAQRLAMASDHCFSARDLVSQLSRRLARCWEVAEGEPTLHAFLESEFTSVSRPVLLRLRDQIGHAHPLPEPARTLSPSDFGLHNALRQENGAVVFLDFEYAGWDDPVKLVADVLWHPGVALGESLGTRFLDGARVLYDSGGVWGFDRRLTSLLPVFGLVWCLILLNEFLPERWQRRLLAGEQRSRDAVLRQQLQRARAYLGRVVAIA
ncbi:MAG: aminoglycoside phosphotransferase family protein [Magnetococcales bacterium]|nr:aminoglycoside phosphotransferase family protein [Magnetococcales bacterium]